METLTASSNSRGSGSGDQRPTRNGRIIRDAAFAERMERACDKHPQCPDYNHGRNAWLAKNLQVKHNIKVSPETIRKWMWGESRPRPSKMRPLAHLLEVDEAWLSMGIEPDATPKQQRVRSVALGGAVHLLAGAIQLDGGTCAFPGEDDPRASVVSVYAVIRGAHYSFHATLARYGEEGGRTEPNRFIVPNEYRECMIVGIVPRGDLRWDFVLMESETIEKHMVSRGGYYEIEVKRRGDEYFSGKDKWPRIKSFAQRL